MLRRVGNNFHVLAKQHHGIRGNGNRASSEAQKPSEIHHDHDPTIAVANESTNPTENVLALNGTENLSADKVTDPNRLRESHGSGFLQAHTRWWWHAAWCRALRVNRASHGDHAADDKETQRGHGPQIPANHEKPLVSQYPPG